MSATGMFARAFMGTSTSPCSVAGPPGWDAGCEPGPCCASTMPPSVKDAATPSNIRRFLSKRASIVTLPASIGTSVRGVKSVGCRAGRKCSGLLQMAQDERDLVLGGLVRLGEAPGPRLAGDAVVHPAVEAIRVGLDHVAGDPDRERDRDLALEGGVALQAVLVAGHDPGLVPVLDGVRH